MKHISKKFMPFVMAAVMTLGLFAGLPFVRQAASAADFGVAIAQSDTVAQIQTKIQTAVDGASSGDTVTVTGGKTDATGMPLDLTIQSGVKVIWKAQWEFDDGIWNQSMRLYGNGRFLVAAGGSIISRYRRAVTIAGHYFIFNVEGGIVKTEGDGDNAISCDSTGSTTINIISGEVSATDGWDAVRDDNYLCTVNIGGGVINGSISGGTVNMTGGSITSKYQSILAQNINISGGTVTAGEETELYSSAVEGGNITVSGNPVISGGSGVFGWYDVKISGGTITATGDGGNAVRSSDGSLTVSGGRITAAGGVDEYGWPASALHTEGGTIAVTGGEVKATGESGRAISVYGFGAAAYLTGTVQAGAFFVDNGDEANFAGDNGMIVEVGVREVPFDWNGTSNSLTVMAGGAEQNSAKWRTDGGLPYPVIDFAMGTEIRGINWQTRTYWTDGGVRAGSFASKNDETKTLKIADAAEFGLFAYLAEDQYVYDAYENRTDFLRLRARDCFAGWSIELTGNIDLSGHYWRPVNLRGWCECGEEETDGYLPGDKITFSGKGFTVKGLNAVQTQWSDYLYADVGNWGYNSIQAMGLFGAVYNAAVTDLVLDAPRLEIELGVYNTWSYNLMVGAAVGVADASEIRRVYVNNPLINIDDGKYSTNAAAIGGVVGYIYDETRLNDASVTGGSISAVAGNNYRNYEYDNFYVGGVCGISYNSSVVNTSSDTVINMRFSPVDTYVGGIVGLSSVWRGFEGVCVLNNYSRSAINVAYNDDLELSYYEEYGNPYTVYVGGVTGLLEDSAINNYYIPKAGGGIKVTVPDDGDTNRTVFAGQLFGSMPFMGSTSTSSVFRISNNFFDAKAGEPIGNYIGNDYIDWEVDGYATPYTTAKALVKLLNAGLDACADEIALNPAAPERDEIMKLLQTWTINSKRNGGMPVFGKGGGLSGGAIAGIVIAAVVVAAIGGFCVYWFAIKKKSVRDLFKKKEKTPDVTAG